MSRRSAVATLLRVAELQEAVARGAAGRALSALAEAETAHAEAQSQLGRAGLAGGSRHALQSTTDIRLWRAQAVTGAEQAQEQALGARQQALDAWIESKRRHRLFETMAARKAEQARQAQDRAEQQLADELAGLRRSQR